MAELTPPVVILDKPQLADNIGAVARVMANFGLTDLRLVIPRDGWPQERAWALASGAEWPLNDAKVFDTVAEAIADLQVDQRLGGVHHDWSEAAEPSRESGWREAK